MLKIVQIIIVLYISAISLNKLSAQNSIIINKAIDQLNFGFDNLLIVKIKKDLSKDVYELALPNHVLYSIYKQNSSYPSEEKYLDLIKNILLNMSVYSVSSFNKKVIKDYIISENHYNRLRTIKMDSLINKYFDENNLIKNNPNDEINALIKVLFEQGVFVSINCLKGNYELHNIEKNE